MPRVLVVTVNYRTAALAIACARSVAAQRDGRLDLRMALVDNASPDDSVPQLESALAPERAEGWLSVRRLSCNGGFGWANNQAILQCWATGWRPDFIWLLNPDCEAQPGALAALVAALAADPSAGVAGSQLLDEAGQPAASAFRFPRVRGEWLDQAGLAGLGARLGVPMVYVPPGHEGPIDWVTGASNLLRVRALEDAGLFDDGFFLYFEEVELMQRLGRAGWHCRHAPASRVRHVGGAATGLNDAAQAAARPRPAYWFASRRRYFTRTRGPVIAWLAGLAWQAGSMAAPALARLRGRAPAPSAGRADRRAMRRLGLAPAWHDRQPAFARLGDEPGAPPRWQEWLA